MKWIGMMVLGLWGLPALAQITPQQEREQVFTREMTEAQRREVTATYDRFRGGLPVNWGDQVAREISDSPNCKALKDQARALPSLPQADANLINAMMNIRMAGMRTGCIARPNFTVIKPVPPQGKP